MNQQWTTILTGNAWNFVSKATGSYLAITGEAEDGTLLSASAAPFDWDIWRADNDPNTFRLV